MIKRYLIYNVLLCVALLCSCVDEYNASLPESSQQMLVVEGSIYSDSVCTIRLTHTIGLNQNTYGDIPVEADAQVEVCGSDGSTYPGKQTVRGSYSIPVGHLEADVRYWLQITTRDGLNFQSQPLAPLDAPDVQLYHYQDVANDRMGPVNILLSTATTGAPQYMSWSYMECFELQTPLKSEWCYNPDSLAIVPLPFPVDHGFGRRVSHQNLMACSDDYVDNRIVGFRLLTLPNTSPCLCKCYYIRVYQEAISKAEYEYEEARRKQSDEMGGLFTPQPSTLPTNIHCTNGKKGVIGFVGVRGRVATSEMYLRNYHEVIYKEARRIQTIMGSEIKQNGYTPKQLYMDGYQVWNYDPTLGGAAWVSSWAVDCRVSGWGFTTFVKPDFWNPPYY